MSRKIKLLALLLVLVLFGTSTEAIARSRRRVRPPRPGVHHAERAPKLISPEEAQRVVRRQLGSNKVRFFGKPELRNKAHDYPVNGDYRPVYEMRCESQGSRYNVDVDAITGQLLKLAYAH